MNTWVHRGSTTGVVATLSSAMVIAVGLATFISPRKPPVPAQISDLPLRQVIDYPELHLKVIRTVTKEIQQNCSGIPFLDDGTPAPADTVYVGCWNPTTRIIWVDWAFPEAVYHELCHASGRTPKDCNQVHVEANGR